MGGGGPGQSALGTALPVEIGDHWTPSHPGLGRRTAAAPLRVAGLGHRPGTALLAPVPSRSSTGPGARGAQCRGTRAFALTVPQTWPSVSSTREGEAGPAGATSGAGPGEPQRARAGAAPGCCGQVRERSGSPGPLGRQGAGLALRKASTASPLRAPAQPSLFRLAQTLPAALHVLLVLRIEAPAGSPQTYHPAKGASRPAGGQTRDSQMSRLRPQQVLAWGPGQRLAWSQLQPSKRPAGDRPLQGWGIPSPRPPAGGAAFLSFCPWP